MSDRAWRAGPLPAPDTGSDLAAAVFGSSTSSLVALSRRRANQIVEKARLEAVEIRRQAREEGLQSGLSEMHLAQEQWLQENEASRQACLDGLIVHFQQATVDLQNEVRTLLGERLPQFVLLASGKAWAALLQAHPEALEMSVKECLDTVFSDHEGVLLSVNPGTLERMSRCTSVACQGDPQLAEGEFVLQSALGQVKGSLEGRIQHLREALSLTPDSYRLGGF